MKKWPLFTIWLLIIIAPFALEVTIRLILYFIQKFYKGSSKIFDDSYFYDLTNKLFGNVL
jgi:hypothetical protein